MDAGLRAAGRLGEIVGDPSLDAPRQGLVRARRPAAVLAVEVSPQGDPAPAAEELRFHAALTGYGFCEPLPVPEYIAHGAAVREEDVTGGGYPA